MAIAIASLSPNFLLKLDVINVKMPSGILCNIIAIIEISPVLYKSFSSFIILLIKIEITTPIIKKIEKKIILRNKLYLKLKELIDSNNKSNIDKHSITPDEKDKDADITLFMSLHFINIIIVPKRVDKPANEVIKKL